MQGILCDGGGDSSAVCSIASSHAVGEARGGLGPGFNGLQQVLRRYRAHAAAAAFGGLTAAMTIASVWHLFTPVYSVW